MMSDRLARLPTGGPFRLVVLAICAGTMTPGLVRGGAAPIPWRTDFDQAVAEARARDRPLWVQFTGPWCLYCIKMDRDTFTRAEVVALSRDDYIPVKVRADEREDLVQRFGVSGLPATVLLDSQGQRIDQRDGYVQAEEFVAFLLASRPVRSERGATGPEQPEIALAGYDVVSLVTGRGLASGTSDYSTRYDGLEFRFVDARDREAFLADPERFLPCYQGRCVVNLVDRGASVRGDPRRGVYYRGRLYLCADEAARKRFASDPARYADADLADAGQCPHCRTIAGRLVRGLPEFSLIHRGRRYLFPDAVHREAFRSEPDRFLR